MPEAGDSERPEDGTTAELPAPDSTPDATNATVTDATPDRKDSAADGSAADADTAVEGDAEREEVLEPDAAATEGESETSAEESAAEDASAADAANGKAAAERNEDGQRESDTEDAEAAGLAPAEPESAPAPDPAAPGAAEIAWPTGDAEAPASETPPAETPAAEAPAAEVPSVDAHQAADAQSATEATAAEPQEPTEAAVAAEAQRPAEPQHPAEPSRTAEPIAWPDREPDAAQVAAGPAETAASAPATPAPEPPPAAMPTAGSPSVEAPSTEPPSTEPPSTEPPSTETPSTETPSTETQSPEPPSAESPSAEPVSAASQSQESSSPEPLSPEPPSATTQSREPVSAASRSPESSSPEPSSPGPVSAESPSAEPASVASRSPESSSPELSPEPPSAATQSREPASAASLPPEPSSPEPPAPEQDTGPIPAWPPGFGSATGTAPRAAWPAAEPEAPHRDDSDSAAESAAERTQMLPIVPQSTEPDSGDTQYIPAVRRQAPAPPPVAEEERPGERTEMIDLAELGAFAARRDGTALSPADVSATEPLARPRPAQDPPTERREPEQAPRPLADGPAPPPPPPSGGDGDGGGDSGDGKPPRKGRRRALITAGALVVVVAVAAGVVFLVPGVAAKLGIGQVGTVAAPPDAPPVSPAIRPVGSSAPEPTPAGVRATLDAAAKNPALGTLTGKVIDPASGDTLWQQDPTKPLAPGSSNKVLTAAAALFALDHDATLDTKVVAGRQPGTAVLVGGGDPTLSSLPVGKQSVYWQPAHLSQLVQQVKRNSHGTIHTVYVDTSRYTGPKKAPGWLDADIKAGNWAPIVPAMLDGGRSDPTRAEGTPRTPHPTQDLLRAFASGIGAAPAGEKKAPQGTKVLGVVHSAPVDELVPNMLTISDNVLAEALGRQIARSQGLPESFDGAHKAVLKVLTKHGFDVSGVTLADSSGLSTKDRIPARLLASVLSVAARPGADDPRTAQLRPILPGLPVAGGTGTLKQRYHDGASAGGKGWVRAKTGTLSAVNTLTGMVTDRDGRVLVFAFMSNGKPAAVARPALDALAATLRGCGCRG